MKYISILISSVLALGGFSVFASAPAIGPGSPSHSNDSIVDPALEGENVPFEVLDSYSSSVAIEEAVSSFNKVITEK